ncbi:MAG: HAMP domain-containing histidine kinase [Planctomycetes bacterium]|nr:HAMP domain-containing histidine kinase [Planctomycetota bacterium]
MAPPSESRTRWRYLAILVIAFVLQAGAIISMYAISRRNLAMAMGRETEVAVHALAHEIERISCKGNGEFLRGLCVRVRDAYRLHGVALVTIDGFLLADASGGPIGVRPSVFAANPRLVASASTAGRMSESVADPEPLDRLYVRMADTHGLPIVACVTSIDLFPASVSALDKTAMVALGIAVAVSILVAAVVSATWAARLQASIQSERLQRLVSVGTMAASAAHEIRNPLGIIIACAEKIERSPGAPPGTGAWCETIIAEALRASGHVEEMLDLSRDMQMRSERIDLAAIARATVGSLLPRAAAMKSGLSCDAPAEAFLMGDASRLRQVLVNLIVNALEAVHPTAGNVVVAVRTDRGRAIVVISDDGPGLPDEVRKALGVPFLTTKPDGVGLGLHVSLRILKRHGAAIEVDSRSGSGTAFTVSFPAIGSEGDAHTDRG